MKVHMLAGGGGGGGGGWASESQSSFGGGGGGGGGDISGICNVSPGDKISTTLSGVGNGAGGAGGQTDQYANPLAGEAGEDGKSLIMSINGSTRITSQGGEHGRGGFPGGGFHGEGKGGSVVGLTGLTITTGPNGGDGHISTDQAGDGGSGGGNGGSGGGAYNPGYPGNGGSGPTFQICFGKAPTPQIRKINSSVAVPIANQSVTFSADLSGSLPPNVIYSWSDGTHTSASSTFTQTYATAREIQVSLTITYGLFTSSYSQTFYVVAATNDTIILTSPAQITNFIVPAGYTSMRVHMLGGGGGGGGAGGDGGGGGGGGGGDISGICNVSPGDKISTTLNGVGSGAGGAVGDIQYGQMQNGYDGQDGKSLIMFINGSTRITAAGGKHGGGGRANGGSFGEGAGGSVVGLTGLTITTGANGSSGEGGSGDGKGGGNGGNGGAGYNQGTAGSGPTFQIYFSVPALAPTITNLSASNVSTTGFKLTFNSTGATSFVYYASNGVDSTTYVTTPTSVGTNQDGSKYAIFTASNDPGITVHAYIEATGPGGVTDSNTISFTIPIPAVPPTITDLSANNVSTEGFTITYSSTNATSFVYYAGTGSPLIERQPDSSGVGTAHFNYSSDPLFTLYAYIIATGPGGSTQSSTIVFTVPVPPPDVSVADLSQTTINLVWPYISNEYSYNIDVTYEGDTPVLNDIISQTYDASYNYANISNLSADTGYKIRVTTIFSSVSSTPKTLLEITLPDPPDAPTDLSASEITSTSITLSWNNPSGTLTGYILYYATTGDYSVLNETYNNPGVSGVYTALDLTPDTSYYFKVACKNRGGVGASTDPVNEITKPQPLPLLFDSVNNPLPTDYIVPDGYSLIEYALIGGGGMGSSGSNTEYVYPLNGTFVGGQGGGAGSTTIDSYQVTSATTLNVSLGAGGGTPNAPTGKGGDTILYINGVENTAAGGSWTNSLTTTTDGHGGENGNTVYDLSDGNPHQYGAGGGGGGGAGTSGSCDNVYMGLDDDGLPYFQLQSFDGEGAGNGGAGGQADGVGAGGAGDDGSSGYGAGPASPCGGGNGSAGGPGKGGAGYYQIRIT